MADKDKSSGHRPAVEPKSCISDALRSSTMASSIRPSIAAQLFFIRRSKRFNSRKQAYTYGRRATPTTRALEDAITELEGGAATILTSSGLGAVSTAILAFAGAGDHILITDSVYQPARAFADRMLKRLGVETTYYDPAIGTGIAELFRPTRASFGSRARARRRSRCRIFRPSRRRRTQRTSGSLPTTPGRRRSFCKPLALGADVSIEAATKYIVGHADAMLGVVTANARAARLLDNAKEALGTCPGSEETYLGAARPSNPRRASRAPSALGSCGRDLACRRGPRSTGFCIPLSRAIPVMRFGNATSPAPRACSPSC